jgi:hypothetical protein
VRVETLHCADCSRTLTALPCLQTTEQVKNRLHILMASNDDWFLNLGRGARRFSVFETSAKRVGQFDYFEKLYNQMFKEDGIEAMAFDLLAMPLAGWHPRVIYKTEALVKQKQRSLVGLDAWIEALLQRGSLPVPFSKKWTNRCYSRDLQAEAMQFNGPTSERIIIEKLREIGLIAVDDSARFNADGNRGWQFLPLPVCRSAWALRHGGDWLWTFPCGAWAPPPEQDILKQTISLAQFRRRI